MGAIFALLLIFNVYVIVGVIRGRGFGWGYYKFWMNLWCRIGQHQPVWIPVVDDNGKPIEICICLWCGLHNISCEYHFDVAPAFRYMLREPR